MPISATINHVDSVPTSFVRVAGGNTGHNLTSHACSTVPCHHTEVLVNTKSLFLRIYSSYCSVWNLAGTIIELNGNLEKSQVQCPPAPHPLLQFPFTNKHAWLILSTSKWHLILFLFLTNLRQQYSSFCNTDLIHLTTYKQITSFHFH